jgi:hypothetical protein
MTPIDYGDFDEPLTDTDRLLLQLLTEDELITLISRLASYSFANYRVANSERPKSRFITEQAAAIHRARTVYNLTR